MPKQEEKANPVTVEKYLKGMSFPAQKKQLIRHAREKNAPHDVISVLESIPEREYKTAADVAKGVGSAD